MNRLSIVPSLSLQDCHRVICSISKVRNLRIININNVQSRSIQRHRKSCESAISGYKNEKICSHDAMPLRNVSTASMKFVSMRCNKTYRGFFHEKNVILSASCHGVSYNYTNVRRFSDESTQVPTSLPSEQMEGVWKILSESAPVEFSQNALIWLHSSTGLPWWATIVIATWSVRAFVTLPLMVYQNSILAKYYNLRDELNDIVKELKYETNYAVHHYKWTESYARAIYNRSFRIQKQKLIERENCHPLKGIFLILVQIPMWITLSTALRNLCYILPHHTESARAIYLELTTGGFGWIMNLTVTDSSFSIPVMLGLLNLSIIEIQCLMNLSEPTKTGRYLTNAFRLMILCMIPLASYVPAAVSLYWTSSSAFGIIQNILLMSPKFRRLARIPQTEMELEHPYKHLYTNLRRRIGLKNDLSSEGENKTVKISNGTIKYR